MARRGLGKKRPDVIGINIGSLVADKLIQFKMTKAEVARKIDRPPNAIKPLTRQPSMQAYMLWEISIAMNYDFFAVLSSELQQKYPQIKSEHAVIAALQKELAEVKQERDTLKKVVELLGK
jgi:hypothetical protein